MNLGEEYSVNQGLVIFDGRIGYNDSLESKQSAAINEGVLLDESFSDQLGLVFKHLNMAIAAVNQHAYLLNTHIPSLNSLLPLLSTPNTIKQLRKELEDDRDKSIKTASLVNQRLTQLEDRFHVTDLILQTRDKSLDDKFKSIEERSRQAFEKSDIKMRETSDELHLWKENAWKKVSELELKIGQTEKETGWKIDDCCQLLKLRPTEEIVVKIIELQFETKKENETRGSKKKSRDKIDELQINVDAPTKDDVTRLINQIVQMENK